MDVKQVQTDTLSHLVLSRASTFSMAALGDIGMMTECINASDIYSQNSSEVSTFACAVGSPLTDDELRPQR